MAINTISNNEQNNLSLEVTDVDRKQVESQQENITTMAAEKIDQKGVQNFHADILKKKLNMNDGVQPETSERRLYGTAQLVMSTLTDADSYRDLAGIRLENNYSFGMYTYGYNALPAGFLSKVISLQGKEDAYKEMLGLVQTETKNIFTDNLKDNYTKSGEEFWITKIKKSMQEVKQHNNDSSFNQKYNDWMYNILYLLHESFGEAYFKKYGDYFTTQERKSEVDKMKARSQNIKIS